MVTETDLQNALRAVLSELFQTVLIHRENTGPLTAILDLSGVNSRPVIEVWVKSVAGGDFLVEGSWNQKDWRTVDTITVAPGSAGHQGYLNAYPYVQVTTIIAAGMNEIEITALR